MDRSTTEPAKIGDVDIEAMSRNVARLIEEGGKALAAYLKPREEGKIRNDVAEDLTDAVKSVGRVAEYWMSDPQRAIELQTSLGRAYLDLWAGAVKRMAGEQTDPVEDPFRSGPMHTGGRHSQRDWARGMVSSPPRGSSTLPCVAGAIECR